MLCHLVGKKKYFQHWHFRKYHHPTHTIVFFFIGRWQKKDVEKKRGTATKKNKQQIADVVSAEWIQDQFYEITESDKQKLKGIQRRRTGFFQACLFTS